jgi:ubiquinone/menaquinone biosynthesis C-methylase UbiE
MRKSCRVLVVLSFLLGLLASAQTPTPQKRATSTPYTGDLSIFDSPGRDQKLQIDRVMDILKISPGKNVADIGAGSGWFTVRAARRVANSGKVYAVDINPEAMKYIQDRAHKEQLTNVETILGKPDSPLLPTNQIDAVLMLKTYHEIADPVSLMRNLRSALRPDALVGVIDRNGSGTDHGVQKTVVIKEAQDAGYSLVGQYDFVKDNMDYFLVFKANP